MTDTTITELIDELYLLHKKAEERAGRQDVQHQARMDQLKAEHRTLHEKINQQYELQRKMEGLYGHIQQLYTRMAKVGSFLLMGIVAGILIIGFSWHHVNSQIAEKQKMIDNINFFYNDLSFVNKKDGSYVRIVPHTATTNFYDDNDKYYDGEYAKLHVK